MKYKKPSPNYTYTCIVCGKEKIVYLKPSDKDRGNIPKYCSSKCSNHNRKTKKTVSCCVCGNQVLRKPSAIREFVFCSVKCKNEAQKVSSGAKYGDMRPKHYGEGVSDYRSRAFYNYGERCLLCGYDIKEVVMVHHIDKNHNNNKIDNLIPLCPTHHREADLGILYVEQLVELAQRHRKGGE